MTDKRVIWSPNQGPQTRFLASTANEVLYGGAAGGGKSAALLALPLRWANNPRFRALILRREFPQLQDLIDKAALLWPKAFPGATQNTQTKIWRFPSGATIRFGHIAHENDIANYDGHEYSLIEFDELTHFTEKMYRALRARIRTSAEGLPRYTRSTTNPGGKGHDWVFKRWGAWLDPEFEAPGLEPRFDENGEKVPPAKSGEVLWYVIEGDVERYVPKGTPGAISRQFIPAKLADNPKIGAEYEAQLAGLDPVRRAQLASGNWLVKPGAGLYFQRQWFELVDAVPVIAARVRYWDRAGSVDGDWTAGTLIARTESGIYYVEHVDRFRGNPGEVEARILQCALLDGVEVTIGIEQDPGQAGKFEAHTYINKLQGFNVRAVPVSVDKITRAGPASAQVFAGNVKCVRGSWNTAFFEELEGFPDGANDDQVDSFSGAFAMVTNAHVPSVSKDIDDLEQMLPRGRFEGAPSYDGID